MTIAALAVVASGCDSDDGGTENNTGAAPECITPSDCGANEVCVNNTCQNTFNQDTGTMQDTGTPVMDTMSGPADVSMTTDTGVKPDTGPKPDAMEKPDLIPDTTPPEVKLTSPADGAMNVAVPFNVRLTFTEPVKNIDKNTVQITDVNGENLTGTFTSNMGGDIWTFTPEQEPILASPYTVTVNFPTQVILDPAGNKMQGIKEFTFFTEGPENTAAYAALAQKYAPTVRSHIQSSKPQADYPTRLNADGDWDVKNNKEWLLNLNTKEHTPVTHYTVLETESHFYIHYVWFWSMRNNNDQDEFFESDAAGAMVVVEKWGDKRPVELLTWFKKKGGEYIRSFPTDESGIFVSDKSNEGITETYAQAELFPGDRAELLLTAGVHESCLYQYAGNSAACDLNPGDKAQIDQHTIVMSAGATATKLKKAPSWPRDTATVLGDDNPDGTVSYELVDLLTEWWPRRTAFSTVFHDATSSYELDTDAPGAPVKKATFPRYFLDAAGEQSDGRTPWAAIWKPGDNTQYVANLPSGMFFIDPPAHLEERHGTSYFTTAWNAEMQTGFSKVWCFNPYLTIDQRGSSAACPAP